MNSLPRATVTALAIAACARARAQAPDNTWQNHADSLNKTASADTQRNEQQDLALARQTRGSVMADKTLSTHAHNVKIVAVKRKVTLDGLVHSQSEKDAVETTARAAVTSGSVFNNLKAAS